MHMARCVPKNIINSVKKNYPMDTVEEITQKFVDFSVDLSHRISSNKLPLKAFLNHMLPNYYDHVDNVLAVFNKNAPQPITCYNNCGSCCKTIVAIAPIEALNIWYYIRKTFSLPELRRLRKEIAARYSEQQHLTKLFSLDNQEQCRKYMKLNIPCEFLDSENSCIIYSARPTICRNHHVVTPPVLCENIENVDQV